MNDLHKDWSWSKVVVNYSSVDIFISSSSHIWRSTEGVDCWYNIDILMLKFRFLFSSLQLFKTVPVLEATCRVGKERLKVFYKEKYGKLSLFHWKPWTIIYGYCLRGLRIGTHRPLTYFQVTGNYLYIGLFSYSTTRLIRKTVIDSLGNAHHI